MALYRFPEIEERLMELFSYPNKKEQAISLLKEAPYLSVLGARDTFYGTNSIMNRFYPTSELRVKSMMCSAGNMAKPRKRNLFLLAASNGWLDIVMLLIQKYDFDPYFDDGMGWNALHYSARDGHIDVVKYLTTVFWFNPLMEYYADIDTPIYSFSYYNIGSTPLTLCSHHRETHQYLQKLIGELFVIAHVHQSIIIL